ncbi:MAG: hypothetical protein RJA99_3135 [Pseudomonadota bacterium]|jgi:hypothetical protein
MNGLIGYGGSGAYRARRAEREAKNPLMKDLRLSRQRANASIRKSGGPAKRRRQYEGEMAPTQGYMG